MSPYPVIVVNQIGEVLQPCINNQKEESDCETIICPYCHQNVSTTIDEKCNFCSFICYMIMVIIFPIFMIYVFCVNKEEYRCKNRL